MEPSNTPPRSKIQAYTQRKSKTSESASETLVSEPEPALEVLPEPEIKGIVLSKNLGVLEVTADNLNLNQQEFLNHLVNLAPEYQDYYKRLEPSREAKMAEKISRLKHGAYSPGAIICMGPTKCPIFSRCPVPDRDRYGEALPMDRDQYPIGLDCVLEHQFLSQRLAQYFVHLNVNPGNPVEVSIIHELAVIDLQKNRALIGLSQGDRLGDGRDLLRIEELMVGQTMDGEPITSQSMKIHPLADYIERLEKRRERWLDRLVQTRKSQIDAEIRLGNKTKESEVFTSIKSIRAALEKLDNDQEEEEIYI